MMCGELAGSDILVEHVIEHANEVDQDEQLSERDVVMHIGRLEWDEYREQDRVATV